MIPPGLPPIRGVGKCLFTQDFLEGLFHFQLISKRKKNKKYSNVLSGVAPAGARVPLRGPMTRGDYGELSLIQLHNFYYLSTYRQK